MTAPFHPGDHVLHADRPWDSWYVVDCWPHSAGSWRVRCASSPKAGPSDVIEEAPAEAYRAAPEDWSDPPPRPSPKPRFGHHEAAERAARAAEESDPDFQRRMYEWHLAMAEWANSHLRRVDPEQAKREHPQHLIWAECCQQRLEEMGETVDG